MEKKIYARRFWIVSLLTALLMLVAGMVSARPVRAAPMTTLIVNWLGDDACGPIGGCVCDGSRLCTLRQAIQVANSNGEINNSIRFDESFLCGDGGSSCRNIIFVNSGLPPITKEGTSIDALTPGGRAVNVQVDGQSTTDDIFTIDSGQTASNNGIGIEIKHLMIATAPNGGSALIRLKCCRKILIGFNRIGFEGLSTRCYADQPAPTRTGVVVESSTTGDETLGNGSAYIFGNEIICLYQGVVVNGAKYVHIGENSDPAAVPNRIGGQDTGHEKWGVIVRGSYDSVLFNRISHNGRDGVLFECTPGTDAHDNLIAYNTIGQNAGNGVAVDSSCLAASAYGNEIAGNLISANHANGILLNGPATHHNHVGDNKIGTTRNGLGTDGNLDNGVALRNGTHDNLIGNGSNLISGNRHHGIVISDQGTNNNRIVGNYIGTNADGNAALGNRLAGIVIAAGASGNRVGEITRSSHNLIAGNAVGVILGGSGTSENQIFSNDIGYNQDNGIPIPNLFDGISLRNNASSNTIGGAGQANYIGYNRANGIWVSSGASDNVIGDNEIAFNSVHGVKFQNPSTQRNSVTRARIFRNGRSGIAAVDGAARNPWSQVSILNNGQLGIDLNLDGVTPNDAAAHDADTGPNDLQNYPVIRRATSSSSRVRGRLNSTPNALFKIEVFASDACDSSGYGEGGQYLGFYTVTTDGTGLARFSFTVKGPFAPGAAITATATDSNGNTSEFSLCRTAE